MELKYYALIIGLVLVQLAIAESEANAIKRNFFYEKLVERMENLEILEKSRENENVELKRRLFVLENIVHDQQNQILNLKGTIEKLDDTNLHLQDRIQYLETREKADDSLRTEINSQKRRVQLIEWFVKSLTNKVAEGRKTEGDNEEPVKEVVERSEYISIFTMYSLYKYIFQKQFIFQDMPFIKIVHYS